jgi:hypothetical protein
LADRCYRTDPSSKTPRDDELSDLPVAWIAATGPITLADYMAEALMPPGRTDIQRAIHWALRGISPPRQKFLPDVWRVDRLSPASTDGSRTAQRVRLWPNLPRSRER